MASSRSFIVARLPPTVSCFAVVDDNSLGSISASLLFSSSSNEAAEPTSKGGWRVYREIERDRDRDRYIDRERERQREREGCLQYVHENAGWKEGTSSVGTEN